MRSLLLLALVSCVVAGTGAQAQADSASRTQDSARGRPAPVVERGPETPREGLGTLSSVLERLRGHPLMPRIPASSVSQGNLTIEAGRTVPGPVAVFEGTLTVLGRIDGDAVAIGGDVVVGGGGVVSGDAVAVEGNVRREGGSIGGEARVLRGVVTETGAEAIPKSEERPARSEIGLALSWMGVLLLIGIGILVFAQPYLEGVVDTLETRFWRSFFVGVGGALAAIPVLVLMVVALAITIIGILLIPFAIVAYVLALAGLLTLGFVAIARLTGGAIGSDAARRLSARGSALRGVIVGTVLLLGVWVLAALLSAVPVAGPILRACAVMITFVAAAAGLGATILSRGGTRVSEATAAKPVDPAVWQTPTPVTGVAAARRPPGTRKREPV